MKKQRNFKTSKFEHSKEDLKKNTEVFCFNALKIKKKFQSTQIKKKR